MRLFWLGCLAALLPVLAPAATVLKISTLYPPGSAPITSLQQVAESIADQTQGAVQLKLYPGGVMGDDATVLRKMRIGQLQGALVSSSTLDGLSDNMKDLSQPFQFTALAEVYAQREGLDAQLRERLGSLSWASFGPLDGGFSYLMSKQPVTSLTQLRQSKLWLPNTQAIQDMTSALGVSYLVMNISDVLTGLDTGAIDTLIAPPSAALTLNWHSRFHYYTATPVLYTWGMLIFPEAALAKIPAPHKTTVKRALTDWAVSLDQQMRTGNQLALEAIGQLLTAQTFDPNDLAQVRSNQSMR